MNKDWNNVGKLDPTNSNEDFIVESSITESEMHHLQDIHEMIVQCLADTNLRIYSIGQSCEKLIDTLKWLKERTQSLQQQKEDQDALQDDLQLVETSLENALEKALEKARKIREGKEQEPHSTPSGRRRYPITPSSQLQPSPHEMNQKYNDNDEEDENHRPHPHRHRHNQSKEIENKGKKIHVDPPRFPKMFQDVLDQYQQATEALTVSQKQYVRFLHTKGNEGTEKTFLSHKISYTNQIVLLTLAYRQLASYYSNYLLKACQKKNLHHFTSFQHEFPLWYRFNKAKKQCIELENEFKLLLQRLPDVHLSSKSIKHRDYFLQKLQHCIMEKNVESPEMTFCNHMLGHKITSHDPNTKNKDIEILMQLQRIRNSDIDIVYNALVHLHLTTHIQTIVPTIQNYVGKETSIERLMVLRLIDSIVTWNGKQMQSFVRKASTVPTFAKQ